VILQLRTRTVDLGRPLVMGVLNVTPDSFSDGGRHVRLEAARQRAREMIEEGSGLIDIGGESSRPGAEPVSVQEELDRTLPVIEAIRGESDIPLSIDTMKPAVMAAACAAGVDLINDINALRAPGALETARDSGAAVCLMHMQGTPRTMQQNPKYESVVKEVRDFLGARAQAAVAAGIAPERVVLDPGFGFGKSLTHNLQLLACLERLTVLGHPLAIGVSRKSMLGQMPSLPVDRRLNAGLAAAVLAIWQGAHIVRTHDVRATVEALGLAAAVLAQRGEQRP
jgi:dihydropteroate synthase